MAEAIKVLAQVISTGSGTMNVYTVPSSRSAIVTRVVLCNRNAASVQFRLSVAIGGAAETDKQFLLYDVSLSTNATYEWPSSGGLALAAGDIIRVYASAANLAVNVFGIEIY